MTTPAHAYDLSTLDGVTFNSGYGPQSQIVVSSTEYTELNVANSNVSAGNIQVDYINKVEESLTITSVNQFYNAGYSANGHDYLPTFGTITFSQSGVTGENNHQTYTLYVHGFQTGGVGLLVSSAAKLGFEAQTGTGSFYQYSIHSFVSYSATVDAAIGSAGFGVLTTTSLYEGPSSPAYNTLVRDAQGIYHQGYNYYNVNFPTPGSTGKAVNPNPPTYPLTFTNNAADTAPPCFVSGTLIRTTRGEVAVEALEVGDEVLTASGGMRPVIWLGSRRVRPALHAEPRDLYPVRILKGAFGEGLPVRDLVVSPGHAVFVDGVLVPASRLINGATVVQDEVEQAHYFHVELDAHDVLLAEGLACESYLDDGNRAMFANGPETMELFGRLDTADYEAACAPVLRGLDQDGEALAAIRGRLAARAEAMGWRRSDEARLTLLADGEALAPLHQANGRAWFRVPAAEAVVLASGAGRPADLLAEGRDRRTLGLAVGEVRVNGVALSLEDEAVFGQGFHAVERGEETAWRWTDGAARLHLDGPALVEVQLVMTALHWLRPARALRLVAVG